MSIERIYIGGLDPSRLTIQEVLRRLRADVESKVELREVIENRSSAYGHVDAVSLQENETALAVLRKLYNNVKWKGCKIRVEAAEPSFMERLEEERAERRKKQDFDQGDKSAVVDGKDCSSSSIPRHLKIRRGYGEESWKVDTKPCHVKDWSGFRKMRKKLQDKREKQKADQPRRNPKKQVAPERPKAFLNRSVHLRFDATATLAASADDSPHPDYNGDDSSEDSEYQSSSDDASSSSTEDEKPRKNGTYVWSDDDSSSSSSADKHQPASQAYVWSDQDDDSDDDNIPVISNAPGQSDHIVRQENKKLETDEFAAGIQVGEFDDSDADTASSASHSETSDTKEQNNSDLNLQEDVQSNLNVLADLYPELAGKQALKEMDEDKNKSDDKANGASGWGSSGQMLRFDPTKQASKQYMHGKQEEKSSGIRSGSGGESSEQKQEDSSELGEDYDDDEEPMKEAKAENVYEQGKLEQVFRDAREAVTTAAPAAAKDEPSDQGFSFGFQLEERAAEKEKGAFSFAFSVLEKTPVSHTAPPIEGPTGSSSSTVQGVATEAEPEKKRRRRGPFFSQDDLQHYVDLFYSLNDGKRMREDPAGYQNDSSVQEHWESQRRILTQDWKRKRKYAQMQRKKRH